MAYGIKYTSEFTSELGVNYKVKILQNNYASAITELVMGGEPVVISYNGDENKFSTLRGSECTINFYAKYDYQFSEIVKADKNDFKVEVLRNDVLFWAGYVIQDNYNEPFMPVPYLVTLRATDGLGDLKFYDFKDSNGNLFLNKITQIEAVLACLGKLKNGTKLVSAIDLYELRIDRNDHSNEALNRVFISPFNFVKSGEKVSNCSDVLKSILEMYNSYIYYKEGFYFIERVNYKLQNVIVQRTYNINFDSPSSTVNTTATKNILSNIGRSNQLKFINNDASFTYQTPYKYLTVENGSNTPSGINLNTQFMEWELNNTIPKYWTNNGLGIVRTGNTKSDAILKVTQKNNNDASINVSTPTLRFQSSNFTNLIYSGDTFKIKLAYFGNVRIGLKVSSPLLTYYLAKNGDKYIWSTSFRFLNFQVPDGNYDETRPNRQGDWRYDSWYTAEIDTPAIADLTFNTLELFILPAYDNPNGYMFGGIIREFSTSLVVNNTNNYEGEIYKLSTGKKYVETYTDFEPVFGEFGNVGNTNQLMLNTSTGFTYTEKWAREGKVESKPLIQIAATSILNQYREPYLQFTGSVKGNFDFGNVYNLNSLAGRFMPFKATTYLKSDVSNIELFELLPESDSIESQYTFSKKANLGNKEYNTITPRGAVDTNRPRPDRYYGTA